MYRTITQVPPLLYKLTNDIILICMVVCMLGVIPPHSGAWILTLFSVPANMITGLLPAQGYTMMPLMFSRPPLIAGHDPPSSLDHTQPHRKPVPPYFIKAKYGLFHIAVSDMATNNRQTMICNFDKQCAGEQLHTHPSPFPFITQEAGAMLVLATWQPNCPNTDEQWYLMTTNGGYESLQVYE